MKPDTPESDSQQALKKSARRRLLGAAFFVIVIAAVLPLIMDAAPPPQLNDFRIVTAEERRAPVPPPVVPPEPAVDAAAQPAPKATIVDDKPADTAPVAAKSAESTPAVPTVVANADQSKSISTPVAEKKPEPVKAPEKAADKPADKKTDKTPAKPTDKKTDKPTDKSGDKKTADSKDAAQYIIQVGVFADADNVKQVRAKLKAQGISSWTEEATGNLAGKTRVKAGPFASKEAADKALAAISKAGLSGMVSKK